MVSQNETMLCQEDFLAAMKDYENDSETEEDGEEIDQRGGECVFLVTYWSGRACFLKI